MPDRKIKGRAIKRLRRQRKSNPRERRPNSHLQRRPVQTHSISDTQSEESVQQPTSSSKRLPNLAKCWAVRQAVEMIYIPVCTTPTGRLGVNHQYRT
jgi:lipoate synthase